MASELAKKLKEVALNERMRRRVLNDPVPEREWLPALRAMVDARCAATPDGRVGVATLINDFELGRADFRINGETAEDLGFLLLRAGYRVEPDLTRASRPPSIDALVQITDRTGGAVVPSPLGPDSSAAAARDDDLEDDVVDGFVRGGNEPVQLHPYQDEAVKALTTALSRPGQRGILCLPTGSGKTKVAVWWALKQFVDQGQRVLWLAASRELLDQAASTFRDHAALLERRDGFRLSSYRADAERNDLTGNVVVASIQTAAARGLHHEMLDRAGRVALVVFDEAHHAPAQSYHDVLRSVSFESRIMLGLSATPTRVAERDRNVLGRIFNAGIVFQKAYVDLLRERFLARPEHRRVGLEGSVQVNDDAARHIEKWRDLPEDLLSVLARSESRTNQIVRHLVDGLSAYRPVLVFAVNLDHAAIVTERLKRHGVKVASVDGKTPKKERERLVAELRAGRLDCLVNVAVLTEGTDIPNLKTVAITRPTMSETLYTQMVGRGSRGPRVNGGKESFFVIDFVDNFSRFGDRMAHRFVLEGSHIGGDAVEEEVDLPADSIRAGARGPIPDRVVAAASAMWTDAHARDPAVERLSIGGWLRWPSRHGDFMDYLVFLEPDRGAVLDALQDLHGRAMPDESAVHETALATYNARLFGTEVSSWLWEEVAHAIATGFEIVVEGSFDQQPPPDLDAIEAELRKRDGLIGPLWLEREFEEKPWWRLYFATEADLRARVLERLRARTEQNT